LCALGWLNRRPLEVMMTRKELLASARAKGARVQWYQVWHAIQTGKISRPPDDGSGRYIYGDEHLERVVELFGRRQPEAAR
jgi:hypothetical protein